MKSASKIQQLLTLLWFILTCWWPSRTRDADIKLILIVRYVLTNQEVIWWTQEVQEIQGWAYQVITLT